MDMHNTQPQDEHEKQENDGDSVEADMAGKDVVNDPPPVVEVSLEDIEETVADQALANESIVDTQHTDGSTTNPQQAQEQGLVYIPPTDPPVIASDDPQGAEVAAGFATSMEESDPDVVKLPEHVDNNDIDLEGDIREALRYNSETSTVADSVQVEVHNGTARLFGKVPSESDIALVVSIVQDLDGVVEAENYLSVG